MADQWYMSPAITITIGTSSEKKTFTVHQERLEKESEYFKVGLNGDFIEGRSKTFNLEKDDPAAFDLFVQYLYTGTYVLPSNDGPSRREFLYGLQTKAYLLGDKLIAVGFQARIIKAFEFQFGDDRVSMTELLRVAGRIYEGTLATTSQRIRNALVDQCARRFGYDPAWGYSTGWTREEIAALIESGLNEFIVDVL